MIKKLKAHDEKTILGLIFIIVFLVIGLVYLDISRKFGKIRQVQNDNVEITLVHNKKSKS